MKLALRLYRWVLCMSFLFALPAFAGQMQGQMGPGLPLASSSCFYAYLNTSQTVTASTATKVNINAASFDVNSIVDITTNHRVTPKVAGKYLFTWQLGVTWSSAPTSGSLQTALYKNGSALYYGPYITYSSTFAIAISQGFGMVQTNSLESPRSSFLVSMNGSTDYVELWGYMAYAATTDSFYGSSSYPWATFLQGCLVGN